MKQKMRKTNIFHVGGCYRIVFLTAVIFLFNIIIALDSTAVTSSLTVNIANSVSVDIVPTAEGKFISSPTDTNTISISTNHGTGYTLGISASTANSNALINSTDSSKTIPSITTSGGITESTYNTDSSYNNTWGYRPSKLNSTANTNYLPAPTSTTPITLDKTSSANSTANNYNVAIGTRVDGTMAYGSYANTFVFTVTANPSVYSITYNKVTTASVSNMPSNVSNATTTGSSVNISSNTPTRTGYTFAGWCTVSVADNAACTGTSYSAGSSWTIDQTASSSSITLYARWTVNKYNLVITGDSTVSAMSVKEGSTSGTSTSCTKSSTTFTCSNLKYGTSYYLYPSFSSGYTFNSWAKTSSTGTLGSTSTQNTYFTMGNGAGALTLTGKSTIVNFDLAYSLAGKSKYSNYYKMQDMTTSICSTVTDLQTGTLIDTRDNNTYTVAKINGVCWMTKNLGLAPGVQMSSSNTNITVSSYTLPNNPVSYSDWDWTNARVTCDSDASIGCWYNYAAASAGTITGSSNANTDVYNICSKGWTLPSHAQQASVVGYHDAFKPVKSGTYSQGSLLEKGSQGFWWASTVPEGHNDWRNRLGYNYNNNGILDASSWYYGYNRGVQADSIRCVAQ